jgi:hypothetical protein
MTCNLVGDKDIIVIGYGIIMEKVKRTPEEIRAIRLANLKQNKKKESVGNIVPVELTKVIHPHVGTLLNSAEFFLYCDELRAWVNDHPDWTLKEDIDDLNGIAMEKVIQFRLLSEKRVKKSIDIDKEFTNSKNREMVHRTNLGARRQTRINDNAKANVTNNIVSIVGMIDDEKIKKIQAINLREEQEDQALFPVRVIDIESLEE